MIELVPRDQTAEKPVLTLYVHPSYVSVGTNFTPWSAIVVM